MRAQIRRRCCGRAARQVEAKGAAVGVRARKSQTQYGGRGSYCPLVLAALTLHRTTGRAAELGLAALTLHRTTGRAAGLCTRSCIAAAHGERTQTGDGHAGQDGCGGDHCIVARAGPHADELTRHLELEPHRREAVEEAQRAGRERRGKRRGGGSHQPRIVPEQEEYPEAHSERSAAE